MAALGLGLASFAPPARAAQFDQQEIDQSRFIVLAAPGGELGYKLLILEQIKDSQPCWSETGSNPSNVDPLLLNFDFTGICNRIVDSNGFSVRAAGQDQALQYSLRIVPEANDLVLIAASNTQRDVQVEIGRTYGMPSGFSRIILNPGWRLTRRAFNGRPVGHVYLTYDAPIETVATVRRGGSRRPLPSLSNPATNPAGAPTNPGLNPPSPTNGSAPDSIIPVPSLPPGASPALPPLTPQSPQSPQSAPAAPSATAPLSPSAPPSLSTILPGPAGGPAAPAPSTRPLPPLPPRASRPLPPMPPRQTASGSVSGSASSASPTPVAPASPTPVAPASPTPDRADSTGRPGSTSDPSTLAQAETYQVIVVADSAELQDKVRAVAPNALLTTINGQVVMQVGLFRDRQEADQLQQRLSREGLPTAVIPVR
ncbi:MAG: DUF3747 domain-containing protein [Elainella sp.]